MSRFIDLAQHGGCSRKVAGLRLEELLNPLGTGRVWLDAGFVDVGSDTLASTVDVVLPMIDDPALFGQIVVAHVLSDVYAAGAEPLFAMNILGLPGDSLSDDLPVGVMLASAARELRANGAVLLGGHSIENKELLFGLAATGRVVTRRLSPAGARPGDVLVLTKPLGTGVATIVWKEAKADIAEFPDVVAGMIGTNAKAATLFQRAGATACTDVTGYGFLGHLHNMLRAGDVGASINVADVPRYESTVAWVAHGMRGTRLLEANEDFVMGKVHDQAGHALSSSDKLYLYDAQVSGGLLAAIPPEQLDVLEREAEVLGQEYWAVGTVTASQGGTMNLENAGSRLVGRL